MLIYVSSNKSVVRMSIFLVIILVSIPIPKSPSSFIVNGRVEAPQNVWIWDLYPEGLSSNLTVEKIYIHFTIDATNHKEALKIQIQSEYEILNQNDTSEIQLVLPIILYFTNLTSPYIFDDGSGNQTSFIDYSWWELDPFDEYPSMVILTNVTFQGYSTTRINYELNLIMNIETGTNSITIRHFLEALSLWGKGVNKTVIFDVLGKQPSSFTEFCLSCSAPCNVDLVKNPEISRIDGGKRYEWDIIDDFTNENHCRISIYFDLDPHDDLPLIVIILPIFIALVGSAAIVFIIIMVRTRIKMKK